jgi:putative ABC transport system permease protein
MRAAPARDRTMSVKYGRTASTTTVLGTTADWLAIRRFTLAVGRFFNAQEQAGHARVAVLGAEVRRNLFPDSVDPVGSTIRVGRVPFRVVGVLSEVGVSVTGAGSEDDRILVPLGTAMRRLFNTDYLTMIFVQAAADVSLDSVSADVAAVLRARHARPHDAQDGFVIRSQRVLIETEIAAQTTFRRLITSLGLLALLVAGAGILSIMLLAVRERRSEIGLRVALGARRRDILTQFLAESLLLALAGCVCGLLIGVAGAFIVSATTSWSAPVSPIALAASIASAVVIGAAFGTLPAVRAARLDPVDALQSD